MNRTADGKDPVTHPLNVSYLVVGLVFLGISGIWALRTAGLVDTSQLGWLLPLTLVAAGVVGLIGFAAKGVSRSRRNRDQLTGPYDDLDDSYLDTGTSDTIDDEGDLR
jgi:hypothetical protein